MIEGEGKTKLIMGPLTISHQLMSYRLAEMMMMLSHHLLQLFAHCKIFPEFWLTVNSKQMLKNAYKNNKINLQQLFSTLKNTSTESK